MQNLKLSGKYAAKDFAVGTLVLQKTEERLSRYGVQCILKNYGETGQAEDESRSDRPKLHRTSEMHFALPLIYLLLAEASSEMVTIEGWLSRNCC